MEALTRPAVDPQPSKTLGPFRAPPKYQLLRILGTGGMGSVVLARDLHLGRLVALKFLTTTCELFLERFRREARLTAGLQHPSIVRVHEFDFYDGRPFLAMDYLDGGHLGLVQLEPRTLVARLLGVVDALGHAHARGIVHRDVKPENVLLDGQGRAYLTDFGLAYDRDEGPRSAGRPIVGTPLAMSPEQARGDAVGPASDVFSLGVTLYRKLTGRWPFRGRGAADVLYAIRHEPPRPLRSIEPRIPRALEACVLRCLEKDPERRFSSMIELGDALDRSADGVRRFTRPVTRLFGGSR